MLASRYTSCTAMMLVALFAEKLWFHAKLLWEHNNPAAKLLDGAAAATQILSLNPDLRHTLLQGCSRLLLLCSNMSLLSTYSVAQRLGLKMDATPFMFTFFPTLTLSNSASHEHLEVHAVGAVARLVRAPAASVRPFGASVGLGAFLHLAHALCVDHLASGDELLQVQLACQGR